jgi:hypothetical protein
LFIWFGFNELGMQLAFVSRKWNEELKVRENCQILKNLMSSSSESPRIWFTFSEAYFVKFERPVTSQLLSRNKVGLLPPTLVYPSFSSLLPYVWIFFILSKTADPSFESFLFFGICFRLSYLSCFLKLLLNIQYIKRQSKAFMLPLLIF